MAAGERVAAFEGGRCRPARDPLPGGDGEGGSVWTPLADQWVRRGRAERIVIAMTAQSATSVADWQPKGRLHERAQSTIAALQKRGLHVSRILWLQGEADAILNTSGAAYFNGLVAALEPLARSAGAPVLVATVGRCGSGFSSAVREAQARVVREKQWAFPGPDMDLVPDTRRYQRCHYAQAGLAQAVSLWAAALEQTLKVSAAP